MLEWIRVNTAPNSPKARNGAALCCQRRKRKKSHEKYDREEPHEEKEEEDEEQFVEEDEKKSPKKANAEENEDEDEEKAEHVANELAGIPITSFDQNTKKPGVIFILEKASLEVAKVGKTYQLLNSDDHANFLKRNNRNPANYRPDISHQAMLMILDSPLNKAGRLRALYVRTENGVLFEVKPHVRIPRTYKRFSGIILQLLQNLAYLLLASHSSEKLVDTGDYVNAVSDDVNLVFVVGAMAHGKIEKEFVDDFISISGYPLSAAYCISRITNALEKKWKIL